MTGAGETGGSCGATLEEVAASADEDASGAGFSENELSGDDDAPDGTGCSDDEIISNEDGSSVEETDEVSCEGAGGWDDAGEVDTGSKDDSSLEASEADDGAMEYDSDDAAGASLLDGAWLLDELTALDRNSALDEVSGLDGISELAGTSGADEASLPEEMPPADAASALEDDTGLEDDIELNEDTKLGDASELDRSSELDPELLPAASVDVTVSNDDAADSSAEALGSTELSSHKDELSPGASDVMSGARLTCAASVMMAEG